MIVGNFGDALNYVNRSRRILPALYNSARENERPIPPTIASDAEETFFDATDDDETFFGDNFGDANGNVSVEEEEQIEDVKPIVLAEVQLNDSDVNAFDALFNDNAEGNNVKNDMDPLSNNVNEAAGDVDADASIDISSNDGIQAAQNETAANNDSIGNDRAEQAPSDSELTTIKLDDSVEIVYSSLQDFRPYIENEFQIKSNDVLCHNRPFKQNVRVLFLITFSTRNK